MLPWSVELFELGGPIGSDRPAQEGGTGFDRFWHSAMMELFPQRGTTFSAVQNRLLHNRVGRSRTAVGTPPSHRNPRRRLGDFSQATLQRCSAFSAPAP
ncbi:hypothetical protein UK23_16550 [Lentzea aerocolonigenes]|uniref:Uncharacterized protein n=1 Tax=Lentzea aerocolonigenes TaxID=68170 RepID=A0A0F0GYS7_LENAE|nr:hypothetical protein UK23_16550 [Lentzea aerocolonigenes]